MKCYQIFTFFKKFEFLNNFKPGDYGGRDSTLEIALYSAPEIFLGQEIELSDKRVKIFKLEGSIRESIKENLSKLLLDKENNETNELIRYLANLSIKFRQDELIKFCYYFFPEVTTKSKIFGKIANLSDDVVRKVLFDFLKEIPSSLAIEFLTRSIDKIIPLSFLSSQNKPFLKKIILQVAMDNSFNETLVNTKDQI